MTEDMGTLRVSVPTLGLRTTGASSQIPVKAGAADESDFLSRLAKEAKAAREAGAARAGTVSFAGIEADFGLRLGDGVLGAVETAVGRLLREAKEHVSAGRHREAIPLLEAVLREQPGHPDAILLLAGCRLETDDPRAALDVLGPLLGAPLSPRLATRLRETKQRLRVDLVARVMTETLALLQANRAQAALADLDALGRKLPEAWEFPYLLAGTYDILEREDEALAAVRTALSRCPPGEDENPKRLEARLLARRARKALVPARLAYREGRYPAAVAALGALDAATKATPLCGAFAAYLARLRASPRSRLEDVRPADAWQAAEELHFFLVEEDLARVHGGLRAERALDVAPIAAQAQRLAPFFPYSNFLRAVTALRALVAQAAADRWPPLDQAIADIQRAVKEAEYATCDPELPGAAGLATELRSVVDSLVDRKALDPVKNEIESIHKEVEAKINGPDHLRRLKARAEALKTPLAAAGRALKTPQAREFHKDLTELLPKMLDFFRRLEEYVAELESENRALGALYDRVNAFVPSTPWEAKSFLKSVLADAERQRSRVQNDEVKARYGKLIRELQALIGRL